MKKIFHISVVIVIILITGVASACYQQDEINTSEEKSNKTHTEQINNSEENIDNTETDTNTNNSQSNTSEENSTGTHTEPTNNSEENIDNTETDTGNLNTNNTQNNTSEDNLHESNTVDNNSTQQEDKGPWILYDVVSKEEYPERVSLHAVKPDGSENTFIDDLEYSKLKANYKISPDNKKVAYVQKGRYGDYKIILCNLNGTEKVQLTSVKNWGILEWSPDSTKILFSNIKEVDVGAVLPGTYRELYVINTDGTNMIKISGDEIGLTIEGGKSGIKSYTWSPDSRKIAYTLDNYDKDVYKIASTMYIVQADGNSKLCVNDLIISEGDIKKFKWSNNSAWIAIGVVNVSDISSAKRLYAIKSDGSETILLDYKIFDYVSTMVRLGVGYKNFEWVSDSTYLIYESIHDIQNIDGSVNNYCSITSVHIESRLNTILQSRKLPEEAYIHMTYRVSPNDNELLITANNPDNVDMTELYTVNTDGSHFKIVLTMNEISYNSPKWFNNSTILYIARNQSNNIKELYSINKDGSNKKKISTEVEDGYEVKYFKIFDNKIIYQEGTTYKTKLYYTDICGSFHNLVFSTTDTFESNIERSYLLTDTYFIYIGMTKKEYNSKFKELYSIPLNGSLESMKISHDLQGELYPYISLNGFYVIN